MSKTNTSFFNLRARSSSSLLRCVCCKQIYQQPVNALSGAGSEFQDAYARPGKSETLTGVKEAGVCPGCVTSTVDKNATVSQPIRQEKPQQFYGITSERIDHLVIFVGGIGGAYEPTWSHKYTAEKLGTSLTERMRKMHLPYTVRCIAAEWCVPIHQQTNIEPHMNAISPQGVKGLRGFFNGVILDIGLYLGNFTKDILGLLAKSLNQEYKRFIMSHPNFKKKVSIVAHSLGSVLAYDLLSHQPVRYEQQAQSEHKKHEEDPNTATSTTSIHSGESDSSTDEEGEENRGDGQHHSSKVPESNCGSWEDDHLQHQQPHQHTEKDPSVPQMDRSDPSFFYPFPDDEEPYPMLDFAVENYFIMGSPLGAFLALRGSKCRLPEKKDKEKEENNSAITSTTSTPAATPTTSAPAVGGSNDQPKAGSNTTHTTQGMESSPPVTTTALTDAQATPSSPSPSFTSAVDDAPNYPHSPLSTHSTSSEAQMAKPDCEHNTECIEHNNKEEGFGSRSSSPMRSEPVGPIDIEVADSGQAVTHECPRGGRLKRLQTLQRRSGSNTEVSRRSRSAPASPTITITSATSTQQPQQQPPENASFTPNHLHPPVAGATNPVPRITTKTRTTLVDEPEDVKQIWLPTVKRVYNILHPFDPVCYRIEPYLGIIDPPVAIQRRKKYEETRPKPTAAHKAKEGKPDHKKEDNTSQTNKDGGSGGFSLFKKWVGMKESKKKDDDDPLSQQHDDRDETEKERDSEKDIQHDKDGEEVTTPEDTQPPQTTPTPSESLQEPPQDSCPTTTTTTTTTTATTRSTTPSSPVPTLCRSSSPVVTSAKSTDDLPKLNCNCQGEDDIIASNATSTNSDDPTTTEQSPTCSQKEQPQKTFQRYDFLVQDYTLSNISEYVGAFNAHWTYYQDRDVLTFLVEALVYGTAGDGDEEVPPPSITTKTVAKSEREDKEREEGPH